MCINIVATGTPDNSNIIDKWFVIIIFMFNKPNEMSGLFVQYFKFSNAMPDRDHPKKK